MKSFLHFHWAVPVIGLLATISFVFRLHAQDETVQREVLVAHVDPALPPYVPGAQVKGHLVSFGTDTMNDLMKLWIAGFKRRQPQVEVELQSQASMSVPASLTAGTDQLSPLSRELNPAEIEAFRAKHGYAPTEIAVALGSYRTPTRTVALTFYVNDANPLQKLTLPQLDAVWCTTLHRGAGAPITEWGQLGLTGEWQHRPIHLVGVLPPDGVPNFIARRVCDGGVLRADIFGEKNGEPVSVLTRIVKDVAKDANALGYAGFHNRQPNTHPLLLANSSVGPYFSGTFDQVRTAQYPLTRFVYIYIDNAPGQLMAPAVRELLSYILSLDGQRDVEQEGIFMPLPARIAAEQRRKLESSPVEKGVRP